MNNPNIVKCNIENQNEIWWIVDQCSKWLSNNLMDHWINYYTKEIVVEKIKNNEVFWIQIEWKLVTICCLSKKTAFYYTTDDLKKYIEPNAEAYYLSMLATLPGLHKQWLADSLIKYIENLVKQRWIKYIRLDALKDYTNLINFYKKRGYNAVQERFDWENNMIFMEKKIY